MLTQYTQAAMVAENRRLAAPASVDSLPTSAMQEDHVSMGWGAARKLRTARREPRRASSPSSSCAPRHGIDLRAPLEPGAGDGRRAARAARRASPGPGPDRFLAPDLAAAEALVMSGAIVAAVERPWGGSRDRPEEMR